MVLYLSTASSDEYQKFCDEKYATHPMVYVQQRWDYTMCKGFKQCFGDDFTAISYSPIQTFPSGKCFMKKSHVEHGDALDINYCGFINLPFAKQITTVNSVVNNVKKLMKQRNDSELIVITHCFYPQSFYAIEKLKKIYDVKVYTIIPDLPDFAYSNLNKKNKLLDLMWKKFNNMKQQFKAVPDGYICFSEYQRNYLDKTKPYIVMEGFADIEYIASIKPAEIKTDKKIIMYAGALKKAYGVDNMVEAFTKTRDDMAELWIYGDGESKEYIETVDDPRVKYKGCVSRDEVVAIEKSVYAMINPRPSEEEYAKCSFPSKLLEYMASGTPVLTTRLESMPAEYVDKILFIDDASVEGIKRALDSLLEKNREEIQKYGDIAREFIITQKTFSVQAKRIAQFIKGCKVQ